MTEYRIQRLKDAIDHISKGNKSDFGRKLDMRDGAFIRQMLAGTRPITEKTIRSIEAFHGMEDWFAPPSKQKQKVSATNKNAQEAGTDWPFKRLSLERLSRLDKDCLKAVENRLIELVDVLLGDQPSQSTASKLSK